MCSCHPIRKHKMPRIASLKISLCDNRSRILDEFKKINPSLSKNQIYQVPLEEGKELAFNE